MNQMLFGNIYEAFYFRSFRQRVDAPCLRYAKLLLSAECARQLHAAGEPAGAIFGVYGGVKI